MPSVETLTVFLAITATLASCAAGMMGVAASIPEFVENIEHEVRNCRFGVNAIGAGVSIWARAYLAVFGRSYACRRFFLAAPLYSLTLSFAFFFAWFLILEVKSIGVDHAYPPTRFIIGYVRDYFFQDGFTANIIIDAISIALTKMCIRTASTKGISARFYIEVIISIMMTCAAIAASIYILRFVGAINSLNRVPTTEEAERYGFMISYYDIEHFITINPTMYFYETPNGYVTTYHVPEPIVFYCAVCSQASAIFFALSMIIYSSLLSLRSFVLNGLSLAKNKSFHAHMFITFFVSFGVSVLLAFAIIIVMILK